MAKRVRSLFFLIFALFAAGAMQELMAQSDNVAAVMSDFALPEYKSSGQLYFILYGRKAVNTEIYVDLTDPILDVVRDDITDIKGIQPYLGTNLYKLDDPFPEVVKFWAKHPVSRYLISADTALYEKNRKAIRSNSNILFRSPEMDADGVGFDVDLEREIIHIRSNVKIHLRLDLVRQPDDKSASAGASGVGNKNSEKTIITANTMDIDLVKNEIRLLGKVKVNNPKMNVDCSRMTLFLEAAKESAVSETERSKGGIAGRKSLNRIECYRDDGDEKVTITLKEKSEDGSEQKSESGKAVYRCADSTLTLTEAPVLHKGKRSTVYGSRIILYLNSDRMELFDGKVITTEIGQTPMGDPDDDEVNSKPTIIIADAMDVNLAKNKLLLLGRVHVDNPKLDLKCHRMIIFLETVKAADTPETGKSKNGTAGKKTLDRIECYEDVVIIRREKSDDGSEQRSESGKAVYRCANSSLTLTVKPVLHRGDKSTVYGSRIILYLNSDRMELFDGKIVSTEFGQLGP